MESLFLIDTLLVYAVLAIGLNVLLFIPAFVYKTDKLTDFSYALTFMIISMIAYIQGPIDLPRTLLLLLVWIWAIRLGYFLWRRIHKMKKDDRFDSMRNSFFKFLGFWLLQGASVFVLSIPVLLFLAIPSIEMNNSFLIGMFIALIGLIIETIADVQKRKFI